MSKPFRVVADFTPTGDQPEAIQALVEGVKAGLASQVLLGVTGSGKTFTVAHVIQELQRPTIVMGGGTPGSTITPPGPGRQFQRYCGSVGELCPVSAPGLHRLVVGSLRQVA